MLGQGLESLIPPQKPQGIVSLSPSDKLSAPTTPSVSFTEPAREESIAPLQPVIPQIQHEASKIEPTPPKNLVHDPVFLPKEEEEKMLPDPEPPAIIHQETSKPSFSPLPPLHPISTITTTIRPEVKKAAIGEAVFLVEVEKIKPNPHQPRRHFDEAALRDLANSIREHGILQPLVVTKIETEVPGGTAVEYQLIAGERRLMASKIAGLERVPVIVHALDQGRSQSLELAIIENLQREDLNPIEMARAFSRLQDEFRMTQREIATRLGKSRETVANTLRLLDLPFDVQEAIGNGKISESHGRLLLSMKDPAVQDKLFKDLLSKSLTTRELRARVAIGDGSHHREKKVVPELKAFQERLTAFLGAPVSINQTGESGRITINFYSHEELESILNHLSKNLHEDEHGV
ncbi:MAG: ParB/RepB/Spo0J family partition protein [Patescibacteria group bacterium]